MPRKFMNAENLSRDEIRELAGCPTCGAPAGEPCKRKGTKGKKGVNHHMRLHSAQLIRNAELRQGRA